MRNYTQAFIILILLAIAAFDVAAIYFGGTQATISHVIISWSYEFPAFTFLFGFAMGHLFWVIRPTKDDEEKK